MSNINETLANLLETDGAMAAAVVDSGSAAQAAALTSMPQQPATPKLFAPSSRP